MDRLAPVWTTFFLLGLACRSTAPATPTVAPAPAGRRAPTRSGDEPPPSAEAGAAWVRAHYHKQETRIPMRDGTSLFTTIYRPRAPQRPGPILLKRTPYSVSPYGAQRYPEQIGPSAALMRRGYTIVYQDVRGCFMSEGQFVDMRPFVPNKAGQQIDENSDTYDTIEWLLANVDGHNGRVGMWGISYPGFYAAMGMIDAHPALAAVSPQAPIADWYFDDFHHHGAFFLPHAFNFMSVFGRPRAGLHEDWGERFDHGTPDGFDFFLRLGSLRNANERYLHREVPLWNQMVEHPNYDEYWDARNLLPHLRHVAPAVMTVGGWFDAEDLYGPLHIYREVERQNPGVFNMLVMGPWSHGGWARRSGRHLGNVDFGGDHSRFYQEHIEAEFFAHYLEGDGSSPAPLPEAYVFETGANEWRTFDAWPPPGAPRSLWLGAERRLVDRRPEARRSFDQFVSDPARPVPFTEAVAVGMTREYMTDDQRFASRRPDVLSWTGETVREPLTIAGPLVATLWVSTSQADADWVVKLIDVFPDDAEDHAFVDDDTHMGGYQMMVRSEVIRGRFRDGYRAPRPFTPGRPTEVRLPLQDVLHTFEPGHRIMVQVQSTWFPLVDRNPQAWVDNIFEADDDDFVAATHRVYRDAAHPSRVDFTVLAPPPPDPQG